MRTYPTVIHCDVCGEQQTKYVSPSCRFHTKKGSVTIRLELDVRANPDICRKCQNDLLDRYRAYLEKL